MKLPSWGAWVLFAVLPACGTSDPKQSSGGGGANPGVGGSAAEVGGSDSSSGGSEEAPGGQSSVGGSGGATASGGSANHAGMGGSGVTGGTSGDAPPDIPGTTLLTSLDDTQKGALCDWNAKVLGGYGHVSMCGMGSITFYADQAECISKLFVNFCAKATAGQFVECTTAKIPSNGCDYPFDQCHKLTCS